MSYILEALKKAEADRNPETRANLAIEQRDRRRHRWLIYGVIAALLANAVIVLWLFFPEPQSGGAATRVGETAAESASGEAESPSSSGTTAAMRPSGARADATAETPAEAGTAVGSMPIATPVPSGPESSAASTANSETAALATATPEAITLAGLPAQVRTRFPPLSFSTHIYAEDPSLRAIVVNGSRLLEGDRLDTLTVVEITEDGAVFSFERYLVSVPVLEGWN